MKRLETFIARRFLVAKHRVRFINTIGIISICGIAAGVAALLIALSVFNGFSGVVTSVLVDFDPHIRIEKKGGMTEPERREVEEVLAAIPSAKAYAPFVSGKAMLVGGSYTSVVFVRGVEEGRIGNVSGLRDRIVLGSLSLDDSAGSSGLIIGLSLADRLG